MSLKRANEDARVELQVLRGRGHDVMMGTDDGLTLAFLERQRRSPFPREVAFTLDDMRSPRRFWLEVLEKTRGEASVEGRIADDGTITVSTKKVRRLRLLLRRELLPETPEIRVLVDGREAFAVHRRKTAPCCSAAGTPHGIPSGRTRSRFLSKPPAEASSAWSRMRSRVLFSAAVHTVKSHGCR